MKDYTISVLQRPFQRPISPQKFFLLASVPLSFLLIFLVPPFQAPDEHTHFYKEVYQSRGHIMASPLPNGKRVGAQLPAKYTKTAERYTFLYLDSEKKLDLSILKQDILHPIPDNKPALTSFENTAQYAPLAYAPQSFAIFLTHNFTGSVLWQLYAARFATVISWLILVFLAIKMLPFAKWGAVALTLTPLSIFLSASASNDAIVFGICLLFISLVFKAIVEKGPLTRNNILTLAGIGLALGFCKPPYQLVTILVLAIPLRRLKNLSSYFKTISIVLGATLIGTLLWQATVKDIIINFYPGSDTAKQLHFIVQNPVGVLIMITKTLFIYPIGDDLLLQLIGLKAWMVAQTPFWLIGLSYITIFLALLYRPIKDKSIIVTPLARWLAGLIIIGGVMSVCLLLYITYTPVGLSTIIGLQGRYFIPFSYLLIAIFGGLTSMQVRLDRNGHRLLLASMLFIALSVIPLTLSRYYSSPVGPFQLIG